MKRGNSFIYIANPSRIRTHLSERLDPKVQRRLPKPTSPCLPVTGEPVWGFCLHTIFPSQAGADPANHISPDFSNAFALLSASHPAVCSWPLPFLPSLSVGSPTHSPHGEQRLVFHRASSLPPSPSHFPRTFLSRHVPSPVT